MANDRDMRIWHEKLIPKLCQKHLCACWREALGVYSIITTDKKGYRNHPATIEFMKHPEELYARLLKIRIEMLSRNYHPMMIRKQHSDAINPSRLKRWQTLEEQIDVLRGKKCECNI